jgi:RNA polymerase sigma-70 factor, ECF subfamily
MNVFKEKILFSRLKNKDKEAFVQAYDLHVDNIYRFIYFKVGCKEEAQDLSSMVFLKAWNHIQTNTLTDFKTLKSLLYKIARNAIIDHYRENNKKSTAVLGCEVGEIDVIDDNQDLVKKIETAFDFSIVEKKLAEMKDEYREIIILRFIEELSIGEIAEILNKSKGNVRILTFRALKALKDLMEEKK